MPAARYALDDATVRAEVARLVAESPRPRRSGVVCYELTDERVADVARTIERIVFEAGFGNDADEMARIYGPYEGSSTFFLAVDTSTNTPIGCLRAVRNSAAGLMTLNSLPAEVTTDPPATLLERQRIDDADRCWDIGAVAVLPAYRRMGRGVSVLLYRAMFKAAVANDIDHLLAIVDQRPYDTMTRYLAIPFVPLAGTGPFEFEGSDRSVAVHGYLPDFFPRMRRHCFTLRGLLARRSLWPLVLGTKDESIVLA